MAWRHGDVARDFVEVRLHHVGVGVGQREAAERSASLKTSAAP